MTKCKASPSKNARTPRIFCFSIVAPSTKEFCNAATNECDSCGEDIPTFPKPPPKNSQIGLGTDIEANLIVGWRARRQRVSFRLGTRDNCRAAPALTNFSHGRPARAEGREFRIKGFGEVATHDPGRGRYPIESPEGNRSP